MLLARLPARGQSQRQYNRSQLHELAFSANLAARASAVVLFFVRFVAEVLVAADRRERIVASREIVVVIFSFAEQGYRGGCKALLAFPKITAEFAGNLSNDQIFEFYQTTPVNLFISVSETEGLPISIMEAISFGIPVMATDVGGCAEIACAETGSLIPKKFNCSDVAKQITAFKESSKNSAAFRSGVRLFWEKHFEVNANYTRFFKSLEKEDVRKYNHFAHLLLLSSYQGNWRPTLGEICQTSCQ